MCFILYPLWPSYIALNLCLYIHYCHLFFFFVTNKGEKRENRLTLYSCCYYYCLLIQDQSVIVRRSVLSFIPLCYYLYQAAAVAAVTRHMQLYSIAACMSDLRVLHKFILWENVKWINHEPCFLCGVMYLFMISIIRDVPLTPPSLNVAPLKPKETSKCTI
jgi:hypothetical protein